MLNSGIEKLRLALSCSIYHSLDRVSSNHKEHYKPQGHYKAVLIMNHDVIDTPSLPFLLAVADILILFRPIQLIISQASDFKLS